MLYLPKAAATVIGIKPEDSVEFHLEDEKVVVRRAESRDTVTKKRDKHE